MGTGSMPRPPRPGGPMSRAGHWVAALYISVGAWLTDHIVVPTTSLSEELTKVGLYCAVWLGCTRRASEAMCGRLSAQLTPAPVIHTPHIPARSPSREGSSSAFSDGSTPCPLCCFRCFPGPGGRPGAAPVSTPRPGEPGSKVGVTRAIRVRVDLSSNGYIIGYRIRH